MNECCKDLKHNEHCPECGSYFKIDSKAARKHELDYLMKYGSRVMIPDNFCHSYVKSVYRESDDTI